MHHDSTKRRRRRIAQLAGLLVVIGAFGITIWIDLTTGLWQQAVILSGIAAGLLTFVLTALFFERWMASADHRRWYPMTHLALTDLLHSLADEEKSHFGRGTITPRTLDAVGDYESVLATIVKERHRLSHALARWAGFLSASADVQALMDHIARLALLLDAARDAVLEAEAAPTDPAAQAAMGEALRTVDDAIRASAAEIEQTLEALHKHRR